MPNCADFINGKRILITGACGVTSRGTARSIRDYCQKNKISVELIGTDIFENIFAAYEGLYRKIYKVPAAASSDRYDNMLRDICVKENIDLAIIVPEREAFYWSDREFFVPTLLPPKKFCEKVISKGSLYNSLNETRFVPKFEIVSNEQLRNSYRSDILAYPYWARDISEGSTSGKGSFLVKNDEEAKAWAILNPRINDFMISEYLSGRNLACVMIFKEGKLIKSGCYERLEYFMKSNTMSGVSGNISRGRAVFDKKVFSFSEDVVRTISNQVGEELSGVITVDSKEDKDGNIYVTEVNLRQVAATHIFSAIENGNMAIAQILVTIGMERFIENKFISSDGELFILRDIDGEPKIINNLKYFDFGECISIN